MPNVVCLITAVMPLIFLRYMAGGNVEWVFGEMESDEAAAGENDLSGKRIPRFR